MTRKALNIAKYLLDNVYCSHITVLEVGFSIKFIFFSTISSKSLVMFIMQQGATFNCIFTGILIRFYMHDRQVSKARERNLGHAREILALLRSLIVFEPSRNKARRQHCRG